MIRLIWSQVSLYCFRCVATRPSNGKAPKRKLTTLVARALIVSDLNFNTSSIQWAWKWYIYILFLLMCNLRFFTAYWQQIYPLFIIHNHIPLNRAHFELIFKPGKTWTFFHVQFVVGHITLMVISWFLQQIKNI